MSMYLDSIVKITKESINIKGVILPLVSNINIEKDDIESIKIISLSPAQRLNVLGTQNLRTWWCCDSLRPFRKKGIIIKLKEKIATFERIGLTVGDIDNATRVLKDNGYL